MTSDELEKRRERKNAGDDAGKGLPAQGWLAVPLVGRNGETFGLVHLSDKYEGEFSDDDEYILAQLAQMAAVAIENAKLYDELREKDQRKDEFLAMLAHELRNPIAAIHNAVRISKVSGPQEQPDWSMEVINRQVKNLGRLIDDLLDVSRITRGKIRLRTEIIDAAPILSSAVESVKGLMEERKHELTVSFRPGLHLKADPTRLEQIIVNLLANAAKYTESGGRVWLSAAQEGSEVVIRVKDTGIGIPPESLPRMFELFTQGDRTLARSEGGLGIGLTIVRSLAEMHGGTVSATSEGPNRGSEFRVGFPIVNASVKPSSKPRGKSLGHPGKPARILVVDDNVNTARGMRDFSGYSAMPSRPPTTDRRPSTSP